MGSDKSNRFSPPDKSWRRLPHPDPGGPRIYINPTTAGIPTIATQITAQGIL